MPIVAQRFPASILLAGLAIAACLQSAAASVDTTPKPGGVYRLKPGIYVAQGSQCESPANAAIRQYDGKGLSTAHTRACKAVVQARKGDTYRVTQSCIDAGAGLGKRFSERQQVSVRDALTFVQRIGTQQTTYRYCPVYQLPPELRRAAR
jgi:hypothetical protein